MHLSKKDIPFIWDDDAQHSFDALKQSLTSALLLKPPDFNRHLLLYLATYELTIGMVLVQKDSSHIEHVVYYLSSNLVGPELRYSHIEKLAFFIVHFFQRLHHYILLQKTTVISDMNPF